MLGKLSKSLRVEAVFVVAQGSHNDAYELFQSTHHLFMYLYQRMAYNVIISTYPILSPGAVFLFHFDVWCFTDPLQTIAFLLAYYGYGPFGFDVHASLYF